MSKKVGGRSGKSLPQWKREAEQRRRDLNSAWAKRHPAMARQQRDLRKQQASIRENWKHKNEGTPETHAAHKRAAHHGRALVKMEERGEITSDQHAWAVEISMVAEGIEADVGVRAGSYEMRVDNQSSSRDRVQEGIVRVRRHIAYTRWREQLPSPKRLVLDMIVGDPMSYNAAARLHHVGWRKARRLLVDALDRWPECMDHARRTIDAAELAAMQAGIYGG